MLNSLQTDKPLSTAEALAKLQAEEAKKLKESAQTPPNPALSEGDKTLIAQCMDMPRDELQKLLQRVSQAGWGYGSLTGKELLEMALKTKDEAYEALKLTALTLAVNAGDWREFNALATFWAEREKGKPAQTIIQNTTLTLEQLVLQAFQKPSMLLEQLKGDKD